MAGSSTMMRIVSSAGARFFKLMPEALYTRYIHRAMRHTGVAVEDSRNILRACHDPLSRCTLSSDILRTQPTLTVSFIIPMHNAGKYISKCIESIYKQEKLPSFEIIAVDDGSTDGTLALVSELAKHHDNLTVISKKNGGAGSARNVGMENARGAFFCFVDADDLLEPTWFSACFEYMRSSKADYVYSLVTRIDSSGRWRMGIAAEQRRHGSGLSAMAAIFGRYIWDDLIFPEGIWYEDAVIDYCVASRYKGVFIDNVGYLYRYHGGAISSKSNSDKRSVDAYWVVEAMLEWCETLGISYDSALFHLTLEKLGPTLRHWTWGSPREERMALFSESCDLLARSFDLAVLAENESDRWRDLARAFLVRSFDAWELACKTL